MKGGLWVLGKVSKWLFEGTLWKCQGSGSGSGGVMDVVCTGDDETSPVGVVIRVGRQCREGLERWLLLLPVGQSWSAETK